ncbi:glycosyltransferase family 2 protein [Phocaeicola faecalis]|uniref:glycosyltransferase family 2 protein n=1 Tax=Phocaeicola faecalis TaxID=2786956 RepID=UPI001F205170|nr:glycosyltransferase family 2 protein [Phocaeicola faecalis]
MKISIITTTYNSLSTVGDTLDSILNQSYRDFESIIIDGASTDGTLDVIKEYQIKFDGRLRYLSEPDCGIYDAMNKGIKMATGDIIGILNSDDFFTHGDVLKKVAERFDNNETFDAVYGDVHFVKSNNLNKCVRYYSSKIFRRKLMRFGFMPAHPSFYMRKRCFDEFGLYKTDYKIAADFEFLLRIIFNGNIKIEYIPMDMVTMRIGGASTSGMGSHKRIMKEHLRAFRENGVYTNVFLLSLRYIYKIGESGFSFFH